MQVYMLNKPRGYITARTDANRTTVMELFPRELRDVLHPMGRLDRDTEGLLLFTDYGMLDCKLLHPSRHIEKEYRFMAFGSISEEEKQMIERGIEMFGCLEQAAPCTLELLRHTTVHEVEEYLPEFRRAKYLSNPRGDVVEGIITVTEGRKHEVKLILKAVGCHVFALRRERFGPLRLDPSLDVGSYRPLKAEELSALLSAAEL